MGKLYHYVGPDNIRRRASGTPSGVRIESIHDLQRPRRLGQGRRRRWFSPMARPATMIGQHGRKHGSKGPPIRYEAVDACLKKALELRVSVHMPRISCGLAGGKWEAEHGGVG